jgi:hypothetical protein
VATFAREGRRRIERGPAMTPKPPDLYEAEEIAAEWLIEQGEVARGDRRDLLDAICDGPSPLRPGVSCALSSAPRKGLSFPSRDPLSFPSRTGLVSPSGIWTRARLSLPRVRGQRQRMALCLTASMFNPRRLAASLYVSHSTSIGARPSQTPIERAYRVLVNDLLVWFGLSSGSIAATGRGPWPSFAGRLDRSARAAKARPLDQCALVPRRRRVKGLNGRPDSSSTSRRMTSL